MGRLGQKLASKFDYNIKYIRYIIYILKTLQYQQK